MLESSPSRSTILKTPFESALTPRRKSNGQTTSLTRVSRSITAGQHETDLVVVGCASFGLNVRGASQMNVAWLACNNHPTSTRCPLLPLLKSLRAFWNNTSDTSHES